MDQERLITLLRSTVQPHTDMVKQATAILRKEFYPKPEALPALIHIAISHEDDTLRQIASVQAMQLVPKKWSEVGESVKPDVRQHLLKSTFEDKVAKTKHSNSRLVASIARIDLADGHWAELPNVVTKASVSSNVQEREVGTYLLFTILEEMGDDIANRFGEIIGIYQKTLKDPESADVRINTMLGLSRMAVLLDADNDETSLAALQKLLPDMVHVLQESIDSGNEEMSLKSFEVFQELIETDSRLLNKNFRDLVLFMARLAAETTRAREVRVQAQNFLSSCVMFKKLKFQGLRLGDDLVQQTLQILAECAANPVADEGAEDDEETSLELATLGLLSLAASQLPPSQIVGALIPHFKKYSQSGETAKKRAGITALGAAVEGAPEFVDTQLTGIVPIVLDLLNDADVKVRQAATGGVKEIIEACPETMGNYHEKLVQSLGKNLTAAMSQLSASAEDSTASEIVSNCVSALDALVDGIKAEDLKRYMPDLVPTLSKLYDHPDLKIKASAISAVGSLAEASGEDFLPYFSNSMSALAKNVQIKDNDGDLELRSMTVDAMGSMAIAVGTQQFQQYVGPLMQSTEEGLHLDNTHLRETSYMFWGTLAKVYGAEFKQYIPGAVKALFDCLEKEDEGIEIETGEDALIGQEVTIAGAKVKVVSEKDDDMEDDEDDDEDDWENLAHFSDLAEEKEVALEALAEIIVNAKGEFTSYLPKAVSIMSELAENHNEVVRRAAFSTLLRSYTSLFQLQPEAQSKWVPGLPAQVKPSDDVAKLGEMVIKSVLNTWPSEDDPSVVLEINRSLADTLKVTGPSILSGKDVMSTIAQTVTSIIQKKHACQAFDLAEEDDEEEEASEETWYVVETSFDMVGGLAAALGPQFGELWKIVEKPILAYASASEASQRSAATGCIADSIRGMKEGSTPYTTQLLKTLLKRMGDEDPLTKSNAAYAVGLLVQHSGDIAQTSKSFGEILGKVEPMLHTSELRQLDNAAGCVSRLISRHAEGVPLDQVLPALVKILPLKEDYEENEPVYSMIVKLYQEGNSTIQGLTSELLPALDSVMGPPEEQLTAESRAGLVQLAKYIQSKNGSALSGHSNLQAAANS